jgi:hypothetical protein
MADDTKSGDQPAKAKAKAKAGSDLEDPPVIPSYERELSEATALADDDLIADVYERYNEARQRLADRKAAA